MTETFRKFGPATGLMLLLVLAFLLGGSSRAETTSMVVLRPLSILALGAGALLLPRGAWQANRSLVLCCLAWLGLTLLHLVPLPPALWQNLPGRELAASIDQAAGLSIWRPFSLAPWRTVISAVAMALPLAALLLALRIPAERTAPVVLLLLGLVLISATMGLLQVIGGKGNAFYTYAVTNGDSAVGLFANRNHNAMFLAIGFPLIAAAAALWNGPEETRRSREMAALGAGLLLIPFLVTTQSRAGLVLGLVGMVLALWVYRAPGAALQKRRPQKQFDPRLILAGLAAAAVIMLTMVFTATNAVERLGRLGSQDDELRFQIWPPIARLVADFFPWGSGMGTFVEVYGAAEPARLLEPSYVNHAHNDWLEVALTGGVPFLLLLAVAAVITARRGIGNLLSPGANPARQVLARLGFTICLVLILGSVYEYPLRTPSMVALFAVGVAFWAGKSARSQDAVR